MTVWQSSRMAICNYSWPAGQSELSTSALVGRISATYIPSIDQADVAEQVHLG